VESRFRQRVRYLRTVDGVQLAWAEAGAGPVLVKAANWLTHLEYELESPLWRHWIRFFTDHFRLVRYDERGNGLTEWKVGDLSFERFVEDLDTVIQAAGPEEPFTLIGMSQGAATAVAYAVDHPDRVGRLVLYGGYARGVAHRRDPSIERESSAIVELTRLGWDRDNPVFRQLFTSCFAPGASEEQMTWFNDFCRKTCAPEVAAQLMETRFQVNVTELLGRVRVPTLVLHACRDDVTPLAEGRLLASGIPGAEFVELDSANHILLEDEPAWSRFRDVVLEFAGVDSAAGREDPAFASLSPRERAILALISEGLSNAEIAERLSISDKTVRNHISNLFDKLGVWSRAQAIVFARDRRFAG
jgi:pimeloyl-ACP methyl ester carboxylesterase/DNA-binding CsgD family transcriptional regulator